MQSNQKSANQRSVSVVQIHLHTIHLYTSPASLLRCSSAFSSSWGNGASTSKASPAASSKEIRQQWRKSLEHHGTFQPEQVGSFRLAGGTTTTLSWIIGAHDYKQNMTWGTPRYQSPKCAKRRFCGKVFCFCCRTTKKAFHWITILLPKANVAPARKPSQKQVVFQSSNYHFSETMLSKSLA